MFNRRILTVALIGLGAQVVAGVGAEAGDADSRYAPTITNQIGDKPVRLVLTGTAMRTKYLFNVYAIGSYVQAGARVRDAEELAKVDVPKQLHLIFERDIDPDTMAKSFSQAIRMNHAAPAFGQELAELEKYFRTSSIRAGDHLWLTSIPGSGFRCQVAGKPSLMIENPGFARAAWEAYLGPRNVGVAIKSGLSSRL
ncbi:MAG: chalcone isomerase family protein [Isosphaeraceae bacterium]